MSNTIRSSLLDTSDSQLKAHTFMEKAQAYIAQNKDRYLDELLAMLRIPSVSADPKYADAMSQMAEMTARRLREAGLTTVEVCPTDGYPVVYAEKILGTNLPTILVYGHYDVQPADPLNLWDSPPFEPTIKKTAIHPDGAIFARGSCDDKGQFFMHVKAVEAMIKTDSLPCNVKFMIEGEEEVGSAHLGDFCRANREKLACDVILISDTSIIANDTPSITTGLRGLTYLEVEVTGPNRDLHSGVYGGAIANPINTLCAMIASLHDAAGRVTIPGFYADVQEVNLAERAEMDKAPFNLENYKTDLDIADVKGEHAYTSSERTSIRPTLDVNGIWGGYTGEGAKTVLPSKAYAKISMRLVPNQNDETIYKLFEAHFKKIAPPSVKVRVWPHHGGLPAVTPTDTIEYQAAHLAMTTTFGKTPIPKREGGSIPIVALFEKVLGVKSILMGFGLDSDALHSPNEHYGLFNFYKGIETIPYYFENYARLKK
jgi:acetylornithine deacetylase/succinyl-diaminopimelate desuccinylase-like protein